MEPVVRLTADARCMDVAQILSDCERKQVLSQIGACKVHVLVKSDRWFIYAHQRDILYLTQAKLFIISDPNSPNPQKFTPTGPVLEFSNRIIYRKVEPVSEYTKSQIYQIVKDTNNAT